MDTLTHDQWLDSQAHEAGFWRRQLATGNEEQFHRFGWYRDVVFPDYLPDNSLAGLDCVDLGSGPAGILTNYPLASRRVPVDPLFGAEAWPHPDGVECVAAMCEATGLPAGSFDLAFCLNMLDHTERPAEVLVEAARLLRPWGTLMLCVDMRPLKLLDQFHKLQVTEASAMSWLEAAGFSYRHWLVPHQAGNPTVQFCAMAMRQTPLARYC